MKMQIEGASLLVDRDPRGKAARVLVCDAKGRAVLELDVIGAQDCFRVTYTRPAAVTDIAETVAA